MTALADADAPPLDFGAAFAFALPLMREILSLDRVWTGHKRERIFNFSRPYLKRKNCQIISGDLVTLITKAMKSKRS